MLGTQNLYFRADFNVFDLYVITVLYRVYKNKN
jgi:hypothetical protein